MMKEKTTVIYIKEKIGTNTRETCIEIVGDKPSENAAKEAIKNMLVYVKRIKEIK